MLDILEHSAATWVAISFVIFAVFAFKLGRKSILNGLDARINEVKDEIDTAERLRVEAQELLAQYQRKQRDAEKEAGKIISSAQKQAELIAKTSEAELNETITRREAQLTERLKRLEDNAVAEIKSHAADIAVAATTEVIAQTLDAKTNANLNEQTISALPQNLN